MITDLYQGNTLYSPINTKTVVFIQYGWYNPVSPNEELQNNVIKRTFMGM